MRTYAIAFDTREVKGGLQVTEVSLDLKLVLDNNKMHKINLCDDPLYPALVKYVRANPYSGK